MNNLQCVVCTTLAERNHRPLGMAGDQICPDEGE
jgi:hypothetical protein